MEPEESLSSTLKYFFGVGDAGFVLMSNIETFYFMTFLTDLAGFSAVISGMINSVFTTVDACLSWLYGGIINGTKAKRWGRYRSWLIIVPWMVPFLYAFMFLRISDNEMLSAVVIIAAAILSHVVWNFGYVANATLVSVVGKTPEDKATLASSRATWNNIGGLLFSYLGLPFATLLAGFVGEKNKFAAAAFCLGVLMVVTYFAHFKMTEGYEEIETGEQQARGNDKTKVSVPEMFASLFQNPPLMVLMLADLAKWCVKFVTAASAIYYFRDAMGNPGLMSIYTFKRVSGRNRRRFRHALYRTEAVLPDHHDRVLWRNGGIHVPDLCDVCQRVSGHRAHDDCSCILRHGVCGVSGALCGHGRLCNLEDWQRRFRLDHGSAEPAPESGRLYAGCDLKFLSGGSGLAVRCGAGRKRTPGDDHRFRTGSGDTLPGRHDSADCGI